MDSASGCSLAQGKSEQLFTLTILESNDRVMKNLCEIEDRLENIRNRIIGNRPKEDIQEKDVPSDPIRYFISDYRKSQELIRVKLNSIMDVISDLERF